MRKILFITLLLQCAFMQQIIAQGQPSGKRQHKPVAAKTTNAQTVNAPGVNAPGVNKAATVQQPSTKWRDDSLLWIKNQQSKQVKPTSQVAPVNGAPSNGAPPNKTKLDDLKNPFDTTKKVKNVLQ